MAAEQQANLALAEKTEPKTNNDAILITLIRDIVSGKLKPTEQRNGNLTFTIPEANLPHYVGHEEYLKSQGVLMNEYGSFTLSTHAYVGLLSTAQAALSEQITDIQDTLEERKKKKGFFVRAINKSENNKLEASIKELQQQIAQIQEIKEGSSNRYHAVQADLPIHQIIEFFKLTESTATHPRHKVKYEINHQNATLIRFHFTDAKAAGKYADAFQVHFSNKDTKMTNSGFSLSDIQLLTLSEKIKDGETQEKIDAMLTLLNSAAQAAPARFAQAAAAVGSGRNQAQSSWGESAYSGVNRPDPGDINALQGLFRETSEKLGDKNQIVHTSIEYPNHRLIRFVFIRNQQHAEPCAAAIRRILAPNKFKLANNIEVDENGYGYGFNLSLEQMIQLKEALDFDLISSQKIMGIIELFFKEPMASYAPAGQSYSGIAAGLLECDEKEEGPSFSSHPAAYFHRPQEERTKPEAHEEPPEPPEEYICPISRQLMQEPLMVPISRHTYERGALKEWEETCKKKGSKFTDPLTRQEIKDEERPFLNTTLKKKIDAWLKEHPRSKESAEAATQPGGGMR
jgi:hypothetical protein